MVNQVCSIVRSIFHSTFHSIPHSAFYILPIYGIVAVAREREVEGDLFLWDMGDGLSFRPGTFDGVISISALQWLCNADKSYHKPHKRLLKFFTSLYACMVSAL